MPSISGRSRSTARRKATIDDQTIVVPLGGTLPDGASATIVVPFKARLRSTLAGSSWLFTRANGIVDMHRWIPWVSRKRRFDRPNHGDPFVTPVSPRVTVRIRTDVPMRFANTGDRIETSADGLTRTFRATSVRDFVITAAADYRTTESSVGNTVVRVISRPGFPAAATLSAAVNAVRKLEARLGPYPYRVLKVVQSAGRYGMEGPGVAWIPTGTPSGNLRYLVTHEIAHQWFYGIVGNDQAREPFADEAATDFVARHVLGLRRALTLRERGPRPHDLRATRRPATTRSSTSRAATCSTTRASGWARPRSGRHSAATSPTSDGASATRGPCSTPSTRARP